MPSMRDVIMSAEVGRGRGLGFLLRQCLSGGVFRWLMLACGEDIDKIIQVSTSFSIYVIYVLTVYFFNVVEVIFLRVQTSGRTCINADTNAHSHTHTSTSTHTHTHTHTHSPRSTD